MVSYQSLIRDIADFPKAGVIFKDITPLLKDADALRQCIQDLIEPFRDSGIDLVASMEARGFILGSLCALELDAGFIPMRKPGKLPYKTISEAYTLEYGMESIEIHTDAIPPGAKVLIVDDVIATGGTARAACQLVEKQDAEVVGCSFLIELDFLGGRQAIDKYRIHSLIHY